MNARDEQQKYVEELRQELWVCTDTTVLRSLMSRLRDAEADLARMPGWWRDEYRNDALMVSALHAGLDADALIGHLFKAKTETEAHALRLLRMQPPAPIFIAKLGGGQ